MRAWWVRALGALLLVGYGVAPTFQAANFGRVYAAYGSLIYRYVAVVGLWVDGHQPDRWDLLGAALCVADVVIFMYSPRESGRCFGGFKRS